MEIVLSLSSPTTPLDAGIAPIVAREAARLFRQLTPDGAQDVSVTDTADVATVAVTDFAAVDGGTQTIDVTWVDNPDAAVIAYIIFVYDEGVIDSWNIALPGEETSTIATLAGAGTFSVDMLAVLAAPSAGSAAEVVVA